MNSFDKMSSSINCETYNMKQFILAVQDYKKKKSEDTACLLNRYLKLIAVTQDLHTFDPHNSVAVQFFISLHELMGCLDSMSNLMWCGVEVLKQSCKNPATHKALIHTYQFLPILSRLLKDRLTKEKKIKLLTLMQELSYGIKISWHVSHIPHLIQTLSNWVDSGDETINALALGVLLNLCYKNLPVIYTLMRTVNTKQFIRTLITTKTPTTEIQICKLLIILEHVNSDIPDHVILNFINVTFSTIVEAFKMKDLVRMRHIVEFFLDVKSQRNQSDVLTSFDYKSEIIRILEEVENSMDTDSEEDLTINNECMSLLIEFLNALIDLKIPDIIHLHPRIISLALNWVQNEMVCPKALALLKTITYLFPDKMATETLQNLSSRLPLFVQLLKNNSAQTISFCDHCKKLCMLLQLLRALVRSRELRQSVLEQLNEESIKNILLSKLRNEDVLKYTETDNGIELCMNVLALVGELTQYDNTWCGAYAEIIKQKQIHMLVAKAWYIDSLEVKVLLFEVAGITNFPKREVALAICDLQPSFDPKASHTTNQTPTVDVVGYPIISSAHSAQIDKVIETFKEAIEHNQVANIALSEVMQLYEYKITSITQTERSLQSGVDTVNQQLQHRLAQMSAELSKLHQLLFHTQQCQEQMQKEVNHANECIKKLSVRLTKEEIVNKELTNKIKDKESELLEKISANHTLENEKQELLQLKKAITKKYESQCEKNIALVAGAEKLEISVNLANKDIQEKTEALAKCNFRIEQMKKESEELMKQHEFSIAAKEQELKDALQNCAESKKILETIMKLTTAGK